MMFMQIAISKIIVLYNEMGYFVDRNSRNVQTKQAIYVLVFCQA